MLHHSVFFFFSSRRRHTRCSRDWSSDVCSNSVIRHGQEGCEGLSRISQSSWSDSSLRQSTWAAGSASTARKNSTESRQPGKGPKSDWGTKVSSFPLAFLNQQFSVQRELTSESESLSS